MTRSLWISLLATALCSSTSGARLQSPVQVLALTHVAVLEPGGRGMQPDQTVVVAADRISEIGAAGQVRIPQGTRVIDATGKYLIPGLWDMHAHMFTRGGDAFFPLYAVAGVTAVRDMR